MTPYAMNVLGIETSCDETGVAVYDTGRGIVAHRLYSQVNLHAEYGGVVPELASRDHIRKITPLIRETLREGGLRPGDLDGIAYTAGPGLVGALMVGASVAAGLSSALGLPLVPVHHMEAHLLAAYLEQDKPDLPFVALLVSGGHTQLVQVTAPGHYRILGDTLDDAVGEAFDKTAKLLGLGYPGGPALAALAEAGKPGRFEFTRPMINRPGLDFSFSGLKTAVLQLIQSLPEVRQQDKADIARAFEDTIVDTLTIKCKRAMQQTGAGSLVVSGGVGANRKLRDNLRQTAKKLGFHVHYPRPEYCTDNGAMIAHVGSLRLNDPVAGSKCIQVRARWSLEDLQTIN